MPRFAEKSTENLIESINKARTTTLPRLITLLSIDHVCEDTSHLLAEHFKSMDRLSSATKEEIEAIDGVGPVVALSVYEWFKEKAHQKMLAKLVKELLIEKVEESSGGKLAGLTFVLTGTLPTLERADAEDMIRKAGGNVSSSVSKKTSYVVAGESAGSKLEKAQALGVKVIGEEDLRHLLS